MRVADGAIVLAQPLAGRKILTGSFVVMTTWIDYVCDHEITLAQFGLDDDRPAGGQIRLFIPLNNVLAVIAEIKDATEAEMAFPGSTDERDYRQREAITRI